MNEDVRSFVDALGRAWPEASKHLTNAGREVVAGLRALADALQRPEADTEEPEPVRPVKIRKPQEDA